MLTLTKETFSGIDIIFTRTLIGLQDAILLYELH